MKRTTSRMLILAVAATAVLGFSGIANAWHGGGWHRGGPGAAGPAYTAEQQAAMDKLYQEHYAVTEATRQQLIVKQAELRAAMSGQNPDGGKIEQLSKEIGELEGKMLSARAALQSQMTREGIPAYGYGYGHRGGGYGSGYGHRGGGRGWGHDGHRGGGCNAACW